MKLSIRLILLLGMLLPFTVSCVSTAPAASPETQIAAPGEADPGTAEPRTESIGTAESPPPDAPAVASSAASQPEVPPTTPAQPAPAAPPPTQPAPAAPPPAQPAPAAPPPTQPISPQAPVARAPSPAAPVAAAPTPAPTVSARPSTQTAMASPEKPRQIGEVVYTEGKVSIHRAGKSLAPLDIGDVVYAYDVVITGPASLAQVDLGVGRPGGAFIRLSENTAFYFDSKELSAEQRRTVLQILSGSIAIKVEKLAGGSFSAASDTAVLGVRGTEFIIDTVPDGSVLVTCIEGAVAVQHPEGQTAIAQPGRAVIGRQENLSSSAIGLADTAQFRSGWRRESFTQFAGQATRYTSAYAATLDSNREAFATSLARLRSQGAILELWREARATGRTPRFTEWMREKKLLGPVLFDCLKSLFHLERPYYRLLELQNLHDAGIGTGTLQDGRNTKDLFDQFSSRYGYLADDLALVREALLLFAWASAGSPLGDFFGAKADSLGSGALLLDGSDW